MTTESELQKPLPPADASPTAGRLAQPGVVAGLWVLTTLVHALDLLRFPDFSEDSQTLSSVLFFASVPILAALVAAGVARSRGTALALAGALMLVWFLSSLTWLAVEFALEPFAIDSDWPGIAVVMLALVATAVVAARTLRGQGISKRRRWAAALVALSVLVAWPTLTLLEDELTRASVQFAPREEAADDSLPEIDEERLWSAQPRLVNAALAGIAPPVPGEPANFLVTVAAGGSQNLFGREARTARAVLGRAFQAQQRAVLLANDLASLERAPLATNTNLDAVLAALGKRADPKRNLIVIYLTAHGSEQAELGTDLPDYTDLNAIGAKTLAASLAKAGIRRRVVIVSACYAGSWVRPLASDDTILVAAARADRTSFGCSDDRELTYFGEALLKGPLAKGASLADGFRAARRTVTRWEAQGENTHSEPQAFIGKNMAGVWNGKPTPAR